jgi:hypothetical protein
MAKRIRCSGSFDIASRKQGFMPVSKDSVSAVDAANFSESFAKPLYGSWCFSGIPDSLRRQFQIGEAQQPLPVGAFPVGTERARKVIVVLVDGLGWRFIQDDLASHPFVRRMESNGVVSKITSQFPSTTVVHSLTMATGLTVVQTGILEWYYYEPVFGDVICPLLYTFAGDKNRGALLRHNANVNAVFPDCSLASEFKQHGVATYVYQFEKYTPSTFSDATMKVANMVPFSSPSEGVASLFERLERDEAQYHYFYIDSVDHVSHVNGPSSVHARFEADSVLTMLERRLFTHESAKLRDVLLLVTADHGQVDTNLQNVFYINKHWPEILNMLKKCSRNGKPIVPCGGMGRNMFLHVRAECIAEVHGRLRAMLTDKAEVFTISQLIAAGIFGNSPPSSAFFERAGDLVILPYAAESVWWYESKRHEIRSKGNHGGLTASELHIPLFAYVF